MQNFPFITGLRAKKVSKHLKNYFIYLARFFHSHDGYEGSETMLYLPGNFSRVVLWSNIIVLNSFARV